MLGQHKRNLNIVPYQSEWIDEFEREADLLRNALGKAALRIEHIGSTSIPNISAKPIIDIMIAVDSLAQASSLIPSLEKLGYRYRPRDTVPERMFFAKESAPEHRTHHLNLTAFESGFWNSQLAFRDYLREHDKVAAEYVDLKRKLAETVARTGQIDPHAKTPFVTRVLELAEKERRIKRTK